MGLDGLAKRYSSLVVCLMLGIAAYFQASGLGMLVGALLAPASAMPLPRGDRPVLALARDGDRDLSAAAILDRNPFDSVTGPIHPGGKTGPAAVGGGDFSPGADPYLDPPCEGPRAVLIAASADPAWSFAAITAPDGKTVLRRSGEDFFGGKVTFIGDRAPGKAEGQDRGLWDRVWLTAPSGVRCQLQLGAKATGKPAPPPPAGNVPPGIAGKIHQRGEHEFDVDRSAVDALIANPAELMKIRVVPDKEGDKVVGLKISGIKPGSLLSMLGMENGDRLTSINGFAMNDPQTMMEAYGKLMRADHLSTSVVRNGKPVNLDFSIK
jgi:general secretion pathway protein C